MFKDESIKFTLIMVAILLLLGISCVCHAVPIGSGVPVFNNGILIPFPQQTDIEFGQNLDYILGCNVWYQDAEDQTGGIQWEHTINSSTKYPDLIYHGRNVFEDLREIYGVRYWIFTPDARTLAWKSRGGVCSSTPIPPAAIMLGTGLIGLAGFRRTQKHNGAQ